MIASFGDRATEALYHRRIGRARSLPTEVHRVALRKLDMIEAARDIADLRSPPGNRLEALKGDLRGLHSIRVNSQWRIVFRWDSGEAHDVSIVDYH